MNMHPLEVLLREQHRQNLRDQAQMSQLAAERRGNRQSRLALIRTRPHPLGMVLIVVLLIALIAPRQVSAQERDLGEMNAPDGHNSLQFGLLLINQGAYLEAVGILTEVLDDDANNPATFAARAIAYYYLQDYDAAINDSFAALELMPNYGPPYWTQGQIYFARADYSNALDAYERYLAFSMAYVDPAIVARMAVCRSLVIMREL